MKKKKLEQRKSKEENNFFERLKDKLNNYKKKLRYNAITHKTPYRKGKAKNKRNEE